MAKPVSDKLYVNLGASQTRKRLKGVGYGVRKVLADGRGRSVVYHTATGQHLRELERILGDVLVTNVEDQADPPEEMDEV